jgi:serine/threonine protein kinase
VRRSSGESRATVALRGSNDSSHATPAPDNDGEDSTATSGVRYAAMDLIRVDDRLGDFRIVEKVGAGTFGNVYLAEDESLGRKIALKVTANEGQEARSMAGLDHENIVRVYSEKVMVDREMRVIALQYIAGPTLRDLLETLRDSPELRYGEALQALSRRTGALKTWELAQWQTTCRWDELDNLLYVGQKIAEALHHAHEHGILHLASSFSVPIY